MKMDVRIMREGWDPLRVSVDMVRGARADEPLTGPYRCTGLMYYADMNDCVRGGVLKVHRK
jgi:hypothetical protein